MIRKFFILSGLTVFAGVFSQKTHTVVKGDTSYNISKKYGLSLEDLAKMNPQAQDGKLTLGQVLIVERAGGAGKNSEKSSGAAASGKTGSIVLQPKQTIYGITKQYHISEADLRKLNPNLDANMRIGDLVTLPAEKIQQYGEGQPAPTVPPLTEPTVSETAAVTGENSYAVQPKDNYYKLTRKFGLSQAQLFALNPGLEAKGLQVGDIILVKGNATDNTTITELPKEKSEPAQTYTTTGTADDYVTYTVQSGDTVFGILNRFGITLDELLSLNPNLSQGLRSGMVLKIKKLDAEYVKKSGDELNVVLMLPFGFDTGDSKYRNLSLDFLSGAKMAIARNAAKGQKLNVKVIDAGNESSFKNSLTQINAENTDLIIGPFFKSSVLQVLDYVKSNKIPVVAPFANTEDLLKYPNLILIETSEDVYLDRLATEIKEVYSNQKIYIVADKEKSRANFLKAELEKKLKSPTILLVNSSADIQLDQNMMTGQSAPVISVLVNDSDSEGEAFAARLIALSQEVRDLRSFSMFYSPVFEKKVDELSQAHLVYLMDRKINTDGSFEKEILADYKSRYCKTPSKYSVIGFDVVNDMLSRENKKGEIFRQMNKVQTQLATKFEFERSRGGAYVNKGYRVVRLVPN